MEYPKPSRYANPRYLDFIRMQPCASCGKPGPSDPHHASWVDGTRASGKADDAFAYPLCRVCHTNHHTGYGMDAIDEALVMLRYLRDYLKRIEP